MSNPPTLIPPEEKDLHQLFSSLREYTLEVVEDFTSRVMEQINQAGPHREPSPSMLDLMQGTMLEALNLLSGVLGLNPWSARSRPQEEDDEE